MRFAAGFICGVVFVIAAVLGAVEWTLRERER